MTQVVRDDWGVFGPGQDVLTIGDSDAGPGAKIIDASSR